MAEYAGTQYVGIDLHRRRSVIVRMTDTGQVLETTRIVNDAERLASVMARAGESPEVVLEATYGWYWAVDALREQGAAVHLAHPLGVKAFEYRRVKNDERDAADLADLLRMGRLPEAWIAPPATRELRELVRHRAKLVGLRSHCKAEVHAVLAKCGVQVLMSDLFGLEGSGLLDRLDLPKPYAARIASLRRVMDTLDFEIDLFTRLVGGRLARDPGYTAVQTIPPGDRPDPGRGPGRRDRRHRPVHPPRTADLLGRAHTQAPRVRHPRAPRPDHQAGLPAGPLGGGRVGADPAQDQHRRDPPRQGRRPTRPQHRRGGRRPPTTGVRLLRPARPPRACPRRTPRPVAA
jgi:Transposase